MKSTRTTRFPALSLVCAISFISLAACAGAAAAADPPPSWNDGASKKSITNFVAKVAKEGSPDFVRPAERNATFDDDGCLWAEQPMYFHAEPNGEADENHPYSNPQRRRAYRRAGIHERPSAAGAAAQDRR